MEILLISTCALFSEVEGFEDIDHWARIKDFWLRWFLSLNYRIPSADTFARVFRLLDPKAFESAFRAWVGSLLPSFKQVAIDNKTLRGSADGDKSPLRMVGAFATDIGIVLGQEAVKNNKRTLRAAIEDAFSDVPKDGLDHTDRCHGRLVRLVRLVRQHVQVIENTGQDDADAWAGCKRLGRIVSRRLEGGERQALETRDYISSAELTHQQLHTAVRQHWGIEDRLRWRLDVIFREDDARIRKDNGPRNAGLIRKFILIRVMAGNLKRELAKNRRNNNKEAGHDRNEPCKFEVADV